MDFSFTEEQTLLRNSVQKFVASAYGFDARRAIISADPGWSRDNWRQFAELGLLAAAIPEAYGGLDGGAIETMIVMEEFGRGLVVEPYLGTVVIGAGLIAAAGSETQKQEILPAIAGGDCILAFAYGEPRGRYNFADLTTTAKKSGGDYVIDGRKSVVIGAPWADRLIVSARTSGGQRDAGGVSLFLVDASAPGVTMQEFETVDGSRAADIVFENVKVPAAAMIGAADHALPLIEAAADRAIAALAAEATGAMKVLHEATVDYCKTRKQFGSAIGKFQVLQHRMVDMFMAYEQSVSITYLVTLKLDTPERAKSASAAKVQIGKAGRFVGQQAVQLHGGMGMTDELKVGHYFKRLTMIDAQFGNVDHHLKRYADLS